MSASIAGTDSAWVPNSCNLPTVEQPLRVAEFDDLVRTAVTKVERTSATQLRLSLAAKPEIAAAAPALAARESRCCGFCTFTLVIARLDIHLTIGVEAGQTDVLGALGRRAS